MKNIFYLLVTFLVIGLTVSPPVHAQDMKKLEALEKELEQLEAKATREQLTPKDLQRVQEIRQEIIQAMGPYGSMMQQYQGTGGGQPQTMNPADLERMQQQQIQQMQMMQQQEQQQAQQQRQQETQRRQAEEAEKQREAARRQWPSNAEWQKIGLAGMRQPAGTSVSDWTIDPAHEWSRLYLAMGNVTEAGADDIMAQIERITGKKFRVTRAKSRIEGTFDIGDWHYQVLWRNVVTDTILDVSISNPKKAPKD